ncbi:MAG: phosphate ABC transporter permease subunit PstC [Miltoncostaeaceae bacterium]
MTTDSTPLGQSTPTPRVQLGQQKARYGERAIVGVLVFCALVSVLTTVGIIFALAGPTIEFFQAVSPLDFFSTDEWAPFFADASFGVFPIVVGTLNVTFWAILIGLPLGLGAAIFLSEYASPRTRKILKPTLEVLEGIPTVAYGFFALTFVTPLIRDNWPGFLGDPPGVFSAGAAGIVLGVMIVPTVASISEDAMSAVPRSLREGAYALGSGKRTVAMKVVVPAALSGIVASFVLGVSRAIGETIVVLIAAGNSPNLTFNPLESIQTTTAFIATSATGDIGVGTIEYKTVFAVGALLFVMTLAMNALSIWLVRRFREEYE